MKPGKLYLIKTKTFEHAGDNNCDVILVNEVIGDQGYHVRYQNPQAGQVMVLAADQVLESYEINPNQLRVLAIMDWLRQWEPSWVTLVHDNPEFDGPNCMVMINNEWTSYEDKAFKGDTVLSCLQEAKAWVEWKQTQ